jgi:hypothetical protein
MTMSMGGKATRKIGLARTEAWWGLKNLYAFRGRDGRPQDCVLIVHR